MKKIFTLSAALILLAITSIAQTTTATCPTIFDIKRNNGGNFPQGPGTCGGDAQIRVYFTDCPSNPPRLDSIYYEGKKLEGLQFGHENIRDGYPDASNCAKPHSYLSYCVYGSNIPPAKKLTFYFTYTFTNGQVPKECEVPEGGPLPINVSSFLVARTTSAVALNWKLEAGVNVSKFEVERSFDNTSSFKSIATVTGNITSAALQSYSYTDNSNKSTAVSFYRLKIVKSSGEVSYSDIKTVKGFGGARAGHIIFPNPAFGNAKITISDLSEPTKVQLLDNSGRLVKSATLTNSNTVELNGLVKGNYMVRIIGTVSGQSEVQKLTVIN
jgi:hypothetical protein